MKNRIIPGHRRSHRGRKDKIRRTDRRKLNGEIVSADSMQIYRFMDIGSAKPTEEEQAAARHHLVDAVDPREPFSVAQYRHMAKECIEDIFQRDKLPVISGGTGLYVNALIYDMDFSAPPADLEQREKYRKTAEEKGPQYLHDILNDIDPDAAARIHPNNVRKVIRAHRGCEIRRENSLFRNVFPQYVGLPMYSHRASERSG